MRTLSVTIKISGSFTFIKITGYHNRKDRVETIKTKDDYYTSAPPPW